MWIVVETTTRTRTGEGRRMMMKRMKKGERRRTRMGEKGRRGARMDGRRRMR